MKQWLFRLIFDKAWLSRAIVCMIWAIRPGILCCTSSSGIVLLFAMMPVRFGCEELSLDDRAFLLILIHQVCEKKSGAICSLRSVVQVRMGSSNVIRCCEKCVWKVILLSWCCIYTFCRCGWLTGLGGTRATSPASLAASPQHHAPLSRITPHLTQNSASFLHTWAVKP